MRRGAKKPEERERGLEALRHARRAVLAFEGVRGVDYGVARKEGEALEERAVRFHVAVKRSTRELKASQVLPKRIRGVRCDVLQAKYAPHTQSPRSPVDPLVAGVSVGTLPHRQTGTLGAFVRAIDTGDVCALSNWHVFAGSSSAAAGDAIVQPGLRDAGLTDPRKIGELMRWTDLSHGIDAAIAKLVVDHRSETFGQTLRIKSIAFADVGMLIEKAGAVSGLTHAVVDGVEGSYQINYEGYGDGERWMDGIHLVADPSSPDAEISLGGDSGSLWIERSTGAAIGLHFAGEDHLGPTASYALAHPIARVLAALHVALLYE